MLLWGTDFNLSFQFIDFFTALCPDVLGSFVKKKKKKKKINAMNL